MYETNQHANSYSVLPSDLPAVCSFLARSHYTSVALSIFPPLTLPDSETVVGFMDESGDHKRCRSDEDLPEISSPEAKRLRDDLLLDDDTDDDGPSAGNQDLASVMKSLEEEIAVPSSAPLQTSDTAADLPNLGYLFEATDDELGLPPPATISVSEESEEATEEVVAADLAASEVEELGYRQMWGIGYDDEINGYDAIEGFGFVDRAVVEADEDDVLFDGGLFDYADVVLYGSSVLPDVSWRSETEPAN